MRQIPEEREGDHPPAAFSNRYRNLVLGLLTLCYALNTVDRIILGVINQAIKVDLKLTDAQLGLLGGFSFAILYTFLGIPIARLAERRNRVSIIAIALVLWSGFTALCGAATSFLQLAAFRVGVGFGEAGLTPAAQSIISDYFPPRQRATALSIYAFGIPLGSMIGAVAGGLIAKSFGWRAAVVAIGAPGVVVAVVVKLLIKEPPRGLSEVAPLDGMVAITVPAALPPFSWRGELGELGSVVRSLFMSWPFLNLVIGMTVATFSYAGASQFIAPYFIRLFGLDYATVGLIVGLAGGISSGAGTLLGGFAADWAGKRNAMWYALVPAIGIVVGATLYIAVFSLDDWRSAALLLLFPGLFFYTFLGPMFGLIQNAVSPLRRATAVAVVMSLISLIGQGLGPPVIGWIIDRLAQFHFAHPGPVALLPSLGHLFDREGTSTVFSATCPGGITRHAARFTPDVCRPALNAATRQGVLCGFLFSFWGGAHFFLASIGLGKTLRRNSETASTIPCAAVSGLGTRSEPARGLDRRH